MDSNTSVGVGDALKATELATAAQNAYAEVVAAGLEQARQTYAQANQAYAQDLQALYAELLDRSQQVYRAYVEALNAAYVSAPSYEACVGEYRQYLERLQQLFAGGDPAKAKAAYDKYNVRVSSQPASAAEAAETLRRELEETWKQQPMREALEAAQVRYVEQLQRLSGEARDRQIQAWRDLLQQLGDIWSQPEINSRSQAALTRFIGSARDVLVQCHQTIEKGSAKAVATLTAGAA